MISGVVKSDEGCIRLKVKGLRGREEEVVAVIDTGYTGSLTLPPAVVAALGLRWRSMDRFTLADGSECIFDVYVARVDWGGKIRTILVDAADADPLVGMRLLRGHELKMQVRARGKVTIKRLPPR
jgi:clan AA aspartic protease